MTSELRRNLEPTSGPVFGFREDRGAVSWFHRNSARSNRHCLYCSRLVGEGSEIASDREHLIARRLVPPDSFSDPLAFNFLFRACVECNAEKAFVEEHVSALTMIYSPGRRDEARVEEAARRKAANSFDPRHPGKPVGQLRHRTEVNMGGIFKFGLVSGPQLDPRKVDLLAYRQIQGFFSLATSLDPRTTEGTRLLPGEHFGLHGFYPHQDWGNQHLVEIAARTRSLPSIAEVVTANGYFRCAMRRAGPTQPWFWALEWNKSLRLVGWIGEASSPPPWFQDLPDLGWFSQGPQFRAREEIPLGDRPDLLFDPDGGWI
ncbi:MAG: hypothetical protein J7521_21690 [Caulobacter sp.]|nr:hypothetical protein [Caulobacter sp.]